MTPFCHLMSHKGRDTIYQFFWCDTLRSWLSLKPIKASLSPQWRENRRYSRRKWHFWPKFQTSKTPSLKFCAHLEQWLIQACPSRWNNYFKLKFMEIIIENVRNKYWPQSFWLKVWNCRLLLNKFNSWTPYTSFMWRFLAINALLILCRADIFYLALLFDRNHLVTVWLHRRT